MIAETIRIQNKLGLHARAASRFVDVAKRYSANVTVTSPLGQADGKSIMKMMMLQAGKGTDIDIRVEGNDEAEALSSLLALVNNLFGEAE